MSCGETVVQKVDLGESVPSLSPAWWTDIFYFLCSGEGKGEFEAPGSGGGVGFLLKIPARRVSQEWESGGRGG